MRPGTWGVALLVTAACAGSACAHDGYYGGRGARYGYGYGRETFRIGADRGYEEGLRHGRHDGARRAGYRLSDDRRYRRGDAGYRRAFGPRHEYVRGFRSGYERGYRDGYESARRGRHGYRDRYYKTDPRRW